MAQESVLTAEAYKQKKEELDYLLNHGRTDMAQRIKDAKSFGDLSENSEYDEALNDQAKMEERISKLEALLKNVRILDENDISTEIVCVGSKIKLLDVDYDEVVEYKILSESQANPDEGIISDRSAVGKALLDKKVGDVVKVVLPNGGIISFEILEISK